MTGKLYKRQPSLFIASENDFNNLKKHVKSNIPQACLKQIVSKMHQEYKTKTELRTDNSEYIDQTIMVLYID